MTWKVIALLYLVLQLDLLGVHFRSGAALAGLSTAARNTKDPPTCWIAGTQVANKRINYFRKHGTCGTKDIQSRDLSTCIRFTVHKKHNPAFPLYGNCLLLVLQKCVFYMSFQPATFFHTLPNQDIVYTEMPKGSYDASGIGKGSINARTVKVVNAIPPRTPPLHSSHRHLVPYRHSKCIAGEEPLQQYPRPRFLRLDCCRGQWHNTGHCVCITNYNRSYVQIRYSNSLRLSISYSHIVARSKHNAVAQCY
jgi:hypothetical protein